MICHSERSLSREESAFEDFGKGMALAMPNEVNI
jgi:hypothetical protein